MLTFQDAFHARFPKANRQGFMRCGFKVSLLIYQLFAFGKNRNVEGIPSDAKIRDRNGEGENIYLAHELFSVKYQI